MRRSIATALFAALAMVLAPAALAQGDDSQKTEPDKTVTVEATDFKFSPNEIEAKVGQTVQIEMVNKGNVAHSYDIKPLEIASDKVLPDESTTVTFTPEEPGEIQFICDVPGHKEVGMKGTLVVTE